MKFKVTILLSCVLLTGCINVSQKKTPPQKYNAVKIAKVLNCDCSIRALNVDQQHIFFAGSEGKFGYLNTADHSIEQISTIEQDGEQPEFRGLAHTDKTDFILSAGNPALVYQVNYFGKRKKLYEQTTPGTFYDAMAFWNNEEGLIIGDPIDNCMSFLTTRDRGQTWDSIPCADLAPAKEGEAAFAASNSNIAVMGDHTWVLSGGKTSRIYYSPDKGKKWTVYDTPLNSENETSGGYSIDFYNEKIGIIIGGDYTSPENNKANKALTKDGGKTWQLIADGSDPGYKSSVKFVPNSSGDEIVAVGPDGISYSSNGGKSWKKLSEEGFHTIEFLNDFTAYAAGDGKIARVTFLEDATSAAN